MKKLVILILCMACSFVFCACGADVNELIEQGKYEDALELIEKNPNKYENASDLIDSINNQMTACEIENCYKEMLAEIEETNPDTFNANFDYLEGADFYLKIKDMLDEVNNIIVRDNSIDNAKDGFVNIFGYEPKSISETKDAINELYDTLGFEEYYDSEFFYLQALYSIMWELTRDSESVRYEMTDSSGFMIIEQPYRLLKDKGVSAQTFAYLLGVCENMGGQVSRDSERIIVTFENSDSEIYYSRGYYYCAPNSQCEQIDGFLNNVEISIGTWGLDDIGVWNEVTLTSDSKYDIKNLSIDAILINVDGEHIATDSILLNDINDKNITFTLEFDDVTMEQLKEKNCSVTFFPAVVMND